MLVLDNCTQKELVPAKCNAIDCELPVAFYPKGGSVTSQHIASLEYTNCCNKQPTGTIERNSTETIQKMNLSNIDDFCKKEMN